MTKSRPPRRTSPRDTALILLLLILIIAVAAGVRIYRLDAHSLWSDEGNSAALATRSLIQIAADAAHDIHPPLYYWLLHIWTRIFGLSEAALRGLSVLLGVLLVLVIGGLGRRFYGTSTGLAAAFIAAASPFQIYYSQEARMYILLALQATSTMYAFKGFLYREDRSLPAAGQPPGKPLALLPPWGIVLILLWSGGLYTHYFFPLMIGLATLLYAGWLWDTQRRGQVGRRLARWGLLLLATLVIFAPWLPIALRQLLVWPAGLTSATGKDAALIAVAVLGSGPTAAGEVGQWWHWALMGVALVGVLPWRDDKQRPFWLSWLMPVLWVVVPCLMMVALGLFREAYFKFLLIAAPGYALLLARGILGPARGLRPVPALPAGVGRLWTTGARLSGVFGALWVIVTLGLVAALFGGALGRYYGDPTVARDDYRGIVQFITATAQPDDAILLDAPGQIEVFRYYYHGNMPIYPLPRQRPLDPVATIQELDQLLKHHKIYALYWATDEADPGELIEGWMNDRGYKTLDQWRGNVRLVVYVMPERRPPDEAADALNLRLGPDLLLLGYRGWNLTPAAGEVTQLQLLWQAERPVAQRYKVFVQLLDARDQVIAQRDAEPAGDSRPTDRWKPGEIVADNHGLLIPPGTPPGMYRRIVGLYDATTGARLRQLNGQDFVTLPALRVSRSAAQPPLDALNVRYKQHFDFGGIALLGYDRYKRGFGHAPNTPIFPGDLLHLTLYWQANVKPRADWWFSVILSDASGHTVAKMQAPLVSDTYATTLWNRGEIVRGEHDLLIPAELPAETYRLSVILLPDTETPAGTAYLGAVKVTRPGR
ncbi:MAG: hypothetical protein FJ011_03030 [Chloroflexi bacterium]|nr:hypothetical protein [Chloroflexota bacterium]